MNQMKKFSALAAGSMAIALLLGTSLAQAEEKVCTDGDVVTGIKGLEVTTEEFDTIIIDVDFVWTTGFAIYGPDLDNLPFGFSAEDDTFIVYGAINRVLNAEPTTPDFAAQDGKNFFYIGAEVETEGSAGATAGWMGANYIGVWERCEFELSDNCVAIGSALVPAADYFVYADLTRAVSGATCDSSPSPPESGFTITPGITGSWFDRTHQGEGFNVEIIGAALDPQLLAYFYTYDDFGNQMWLTGVAPANGDTAVVPMEVTSGPVFGDDFDPTDVVTEAWGTITFTFSSCGAGTAAYTSPDFGNGSFNIERLTTVTGLNCP
jgi:hypothetical protein